MRIARNDLHFNTEFNLFEQNYFVHFMAAYLLIKVNLKCFQTMLIIIISGIKTFTPSLYRSIQNTAAFAINVSF